MPTNDSFQGVLNCYVFKSRLQEYAQKVGLRTPVYQTVKEGPSHEPYFRSSVIVNDVTYNSLTGFLNRKAAEQSAAEVALVELVKSGDVHQTISLPVHETGLCKNLLQEYAQKMNYAIPLYQCQADEAAGRTASYQCTIEIGGTRYIGASAKTKKEAELKAARTALLAIQSFAARSGDESVETTQLTVLPCKKRPAEPVAAKPEQTPRKAKAKRKPTNGVISRGFKKKMSQARKRNNAAKSDQLVDLDCAKPTGPESMPNPQNVTSQLETERFSVEAPCVCHVSEPASGSLDPVSGGPIAPVFNVRDSSDVNIEKSTDGIAATGELLETGSAPATNLISYSE